MLTQALALQHFVYADGVLTRRITTSSNAKAGSIAGSPGSSGYLQVRVLGKLHLAHRVVFVMHHGYLPEFIDHIDGNKTNNRIENLRPATKSLNGSNRAKLKKNVSGFKGVWYCPRNKRWRAGITIDGKRKNLGYFNNPEDAHLYYCINALRHFGDFARF